MRSVFSKLGQWLKGPEPGTPANELIDLKLRYAEFKYLLRANNEVLSLIAEIESRLMAGDPVGTRFLIPRYTAAAARVYKMILHLNRISGGVYPGLFDAFNRIRLEIDKAVAQARRPEDDVYVLPLQAVDASLADLTGGKAANLAAVARFGLPGRQGFVLTATAFRRLMKASGIREYIHHELTLLEDASFANLAAMSDRIKRKIAGIVPPEDLVQAIERAVTDLIGPRGPGARLSVRSSALGEDSDSSFAGQYKTILNVPPEKVISAYIEVVTSLYETQAMVYRRRRGFRDEDAEMAVLILVMLRPESSGVMYTRDPRPRRDTELLINSVFGLGRGLVDGEVNPDGYWLDRVGEPRLIRQIIAEKKVRLMASGDGISTEPMPPELVSRPTLSAEQAEELARIGLRLEAGFGGPQDVEWSYLPEEGFVILQSRPLHVLDSNEAESGGERSTEAVVLYSGGESVRQGVAAGPVHFVVKEEDLATFPEGGVLVAHKSSPIFGAVFDYAAAVVTEIGGVTGHMASLAREAGIPTIVGAQGVLHLLEQGQEVTVDAGACQIYRGREKSLLDKNCPTGLDCRAKVQPTRAHPVARHITALTLKNPNSDAFRPENCQTFHDIIRFVHEMSFREMFRLGDHLGRAATTDAKRFSQLLPFELWIIDLGGGLTAEDTRKPSINEIASVPGRGFLEGLLDPRIHWNRPRPVSMRGLMSVMTGSVLHPDAQGQERDFGARAYAIMSSEYLNFNSRVGYHFAALDSVCGPTLNNNYISYLFRGGAATEDRRILRVEMIGRILADLGFQVDRKGDAVSAFLKKHDCEETSRKLADLGRLTLFTRQMDMLTHDRRMANWLARAFLNGNFNLEPDFDAEARSAP